MQGIGAKISRRAALARDDKVGSIPEFSEKCKTATICHADGQWPPLQFFDKERAALVSGSFVLD
jgi:hypothetical protein